MKLRHTYNLAYMDSDEIERVLDAAYRASHFTSVDELTDALGDLSYAMKKLEPLRTTEIQITMEGDQQQHSHRDA